MIELELFLIIGKARTGDFSVLWPERLSITDARTRMSESWLQIHAAHSAQRSASLWRQDDKVILALTRQESGVDSAGRPLHKLFAYAARNPPPYADLARLLLWIYRQDFGNERPPLLQEIGPRGLEDDEITLDKGERDRGAAALAILAADSCRVQNTKTAQAIVDALSFDQVGFLSLFPSAVPSWPAAGPGIIVSRSIWEAPPDAARLAEMGLTSEATDLIGLMRLPRDRARRFALAAATLTGECVNLGLLSDQELKWLHSQERTRAPALAQASAEQIANLFAEGKIDSRALDGLAADQLRKIPPFAAAKALQGRQNALSKFVAVFGHNVQGLELLLPERVARLVTAQQGAVVSPEQIFDLTLEDIDLMERVGVFETMPLRWLSAISSMRPHPLIEDHYARRMRELLPEPLVLCLLGLPTSGADGAIALSHSSPPEPRAEWLCGIGFERLLDAGSICIDDRTWRRWWADALRVHPGARTRDVASLTAPWSRETVAWLVASARDGEISSVDVCKRIEAFVLAYAPIELKDLTELLTAAGVTRAHEMAHIVQGQNPTECEVDQQFATEVRYLMETGVITNAALHQAVRSGLPLTALSLLSEDASAIALLAVDQPAPIRPPSSWHAFLTQELRWRMVKPDFWNRWPRGVSQPLLTWMRDQVAGEPEEAIVGALLAAGKRSRLLDVSELVRVAGGIAPLDLVWQIVEHAKNSKSDRGQLLELLDRCPLRSDLAHFLRCELAVPSAGSPVPKLSAAEMLAILPMLHPTRDVIRQILSHPSIEPEEGLLLSETVEAVRRTGYSLPLSAPAAEQAERRPNWIAALSELPGWEHWQHLK